MGQTTNAEAGRHGLGICAVVDGEVLTLLPFDLLKLRQQFIISLRRLVSSALPFAIVAFL